jgi:hypothetical protein
MAAEDREPADSIEKASPVEFSEVRVVWWSVIAQSLSSIGTGQLALAGVIWYAFLSITYNQFYEPLGINPSDVGLNYASVLANSAGAALILVVPVIVMILSFTVVTLLLPWLLLLLALLGRLLWRRLERIPAPYVGVRRFTRIRYRSYRQRIFTRIFGVLLAIMAISTTAIIIYQIPIRAGSEADIVKSGGVVGPLHFFNSPFPVLGIHADPVVSIRPATTNKTGESSAVETLQPGRLLYMGQANGMVVFYDSVAKQATYVPASSIVLTVKSNAGQYLP